MTKPPPRVIMRHMKQLVIFRGPSGSGKSTAAKKFAKDSGVGFDGVHFEADQFFMVLGKYQFDATKLGQAHGWCQRQVRESMEAGLKLVIVSNTSMTKWEVNPYVALAEEFDYEVVIYKIKGPWDAKLYASRNAHNVPLHVVQKQIDKYQPIEGETEYE